jgi:hypothetical protein
MWIFRGRSGRKRSASGLPPGATNYTTARGAKRLREELQKVRAANPGSERVAELEQILASIHVVDPTDAPANSVTFGATMKVQDKKGATETFTHRGCRRTRFRTRRGELDFFTRQSAAERGNGRLDYTWRRTNRKNHEDRGIVDR